MVRRRDGVHAYQLAVVVDDAARASIAWYVAPTCWTAAAGRRSLQVALGLPEVAYMHVPLVTEPDGGKLAKSAHSVAVPPVGDAGLLHRVLTLLRQQPPAELSRGTVRAVWEWAGALAACAARGNRSAGSGAAPGLRCAV